MGSRGTADDASSFDPYAVLAVDERASGREIREAYLSLAMLLHPDRTGGASVRSLARRLGEFRKNEAPNLASMRLKADAQFCVLDRAYRILSNCQKRRAYDSFGMSGVLTLEGLEGSNGAIVLRSKFPDDIDKLLAFIMREEKQRLLEVGSAVAGHFVVDAGIFPRRDANGNILWHTCFVPLVREMIIQQSVDLPLSQSTGMQIGGYSLSRGGASMGAATIELRHNLDQERGGSTWIAVGGELGHNRHLNVSTGKRFDSRTTGTLTGTLKRSGASLRIGSSRQLSKGFAAQASCDLGTSSSFSFYLHQSREGGRAGARGEVMAGEDGSVSLRISYQRQLSKHSKGDAGFKIGNRGIEIYCHKSHTLRRQAKMKVGVSVDLRGVKAVLHMQRGAMRFHFPLRISPRGLLSMDPLAIVIASALSVVVDHLIGKISAPILAARDEEAKQTDHEALVARLEKKRCDAAAQCQLMVHAADRKAAGELESGGLVIRSARYGRDLHIDYGPWWLSSTGDSSSGQAEQRNIDVTVPLQFFVDKGELSLPGRSKAGLLGFYAVGNDGASRHSEHAQLRVRYEYAGRLFEITVDDEEPLQLPGVSTHYIGRADVVQ